MSDAESPLIFTDSAANKVKTLIDEEGNDNLKLRVYVTGGGCSGFQYGFTFDEAVNDGDTAVEKKESHESTESPTAPPLIGYDDPDALKKAILHYEILGKPIALRDPFERTSLS